MEHIKELLAKRKMSLFAARHENSGKGSHEWNAFNAVRDDRIEMFPVATPRVRETPRYPNIVPIHRYPRHLTPKFSH